METNLKEIDITKYNSYIWKIANTYRVSNDVRAELVHEGNIGIYEASLKYEEIHGISFISFATYYIKKNMSKYIQDHLRTVRIPANKQRALRKYQKIEDPYTADLSTFSNEDLKFINSDAHSPIMSLDVPLGDSYNSSTFGDELPDEEIDEIYNQDQVKQLLKAVDQLKPSYKELIIKKYGLNEEEPMTLRQIGIEKKTSFENIRQKVERAEKKLKEILK